MGNRWRFPRERRHPPLLDLTDPFPGLVGKPVPYEPIEDQTPLGTYCSCPPEGQDWNAVHDGGCRTVFAFCATCGMDVDPADLDP